MKINDMGKRFLREGPINKIKKYNFTCVYCLRKYYTAKIIIHIKNCANRHQDTILNREQIKIDILLYLLDQKTFLNPHVYFDGRINNFILIIYNILRRIRLQEYRVETVKLLFKKIPYLHRTILLNFIEEIKSYPIFIFPHLIPLVSLTNNWHQSCCINHIDHIYKNYHHYFQLVRSSNPMTFYDGYFRNK